MLRSFVFRAVVRRPIGRDPANSKARPTPQDSPTTAAQQGQAAETATKPPPSSWPATPIMVLESSFFVRAMQVAGAVQAAFCAQMAYNSRDMRDKEDKTKQESLSLRAAAGLTFSVLAALIAGAALLAPRRFVTKLTVRDPGVALVETFSWLGTRTLEVPLKKISFPSVDPRRILEGNFVAEKSTSKYVLMKIEGFRYGFVLSGHVRDPKAYVRLLQNVPKSVA